MTEMVGPSVDFLDDAVWNAEREAVEVTALVNDGERQYRLSTTIAQEALEELVQASGSLDKLRVFRDHESQLAGVAAQRYNPRHPVILITARDLAE